MSARKTIGAAEFRRLGLLTEVNRRLLHPLGLALEVVVDEDGTERFGEVWDERDDPGGIAYPNLNEEAAANVRAMERERRAGRLADVGYWVQPAKADAPRRRVVMHIEVGADSWDEAISALDQVALDVLDSRRDTPTGPVRIVSGGASRGWAVYGDEHPHVTHDSYFEGVHRWLGRADRDSDDTLPTVPRGPAGPEST